RSGKPFISVNMAAVPASTCAAALFGHAKGAFTGAVGATSGFFGSADGGTLFLDEIGETTLELQAALLRALESGEVQPVGEERTRKVDVRLIAATDMDLERAVEEGRFRRALLERLRSYEIRVAPLRERREDVGCLLVHFLRQQLDKVGAGDLLAPPEEGKRPWLPAWLVADAVRYEWPGNVRELRNVACQLAIDWADAAEVLPDAEVKRLVGSDRLREARLSSTADTNGRSEDGAAEPEERERQPAVSLDDETVMAALRANGWQPSAAATALGVSRSALYAFIRQSPNIPKATSLQPEQVQQVLDEHGGDTGQAADALCVTERALKLRMRELGLG
ncbi:MAG: sigma-54-dependent Fis family transcriptional regulator, partial [Deltaproteobacteria bacterium]|nr:sigma-54-dependent Fis family transcriptional regulator [Deltaproteobacteria bacterium]MBW2530409.1 sigma-54-dependent Fis family transcriptional regulator [Deltaproteobacteria bacterium]